MIKDYFLLALRNLLRRKLRSWLTMIGIFIGIAALVSLTALGQGLENAITDQFEKLGTNKVIVSPGSFGAGPPGTSVRKLNEHDKELISRVRGVENVAPFTFRTISITFNDKTQFLTAHGITTEEKEKRLVYEAQTIEIDKGRDLKKTDDKNILIGYDLAHDDTIFGKVIKINDRVTIENKDFRVIGTVKRIGNPVDDKHAYFTLNADEEITGQKEAYDFIFVETSKGLAPSDVAERVKQAMRRDRNKKEGEEDFSVETLENISNTFGSILFIVQAVIIGIASISVVVGGVGIMNTMYTAVIERTREIGIMKAIGAKTSDITTIFIFESGLLGFVGGAIGVLLGAGLSKLVEYIASTIWGTPLVQAAISPTLVIGALFFSFLIGTISGLLPALQAAKLKPVDALRYE